MVLPDLEGYRLHPSQRAAFELFAKEFDVRSFEHQIGSDLVAELYTPKRSGFVRLSPGDPYARISVESAKDTHHVVRGSTIIEYFTLAVEDDDLIVRYVHGDANRIPLERIANGPRSNLTLQAILGVSRRRFNDYAKSEST